MDITRASDYTNARLSLRDDFLSPEQVAIGSGYAYEVEQLEELAATVPSVEELAVLLGNGYGFMPKPPSSLSILSMHQRNPEYFFSTKTGWKARQTNYDDGGNNTIPQKFAWYEAGQPFAGDCLTGSSGWLAIRKTPISGSFEKTWAEQLQLLSGNEYTPNAAELVWFMTTYFAVRGIWLFKDVLARTMSLDAEGHHVYGGYFPSKGILLNNYYMDDRKECILGLAVAKRL